MIFTLAGFAGAGRVFGIINNVIQLVKDCPTDIECFQRAPVTNQLLKVGEIDFDDLGGRMLGSVAQPATRESTAKNHIATIAGVL